MQKKVLALPIFICFVQIAATQTVATIEAPNMRYQLKAPEGWYFYQPEHQTGRVAVLLPDGETLTSGDHLMYALDVPYEKGYATVEEVLQGDLNAENAVMNHVKVLHDSTIAISEGVEARVIYFSPFLVDGQLNWQANAYIGNGTGCLKISFATINEEAFKANMSEFDQVVHSYVFIESWGTKTNTNRTIIKQ